jgi:transcriptional regulator of heat shock response
MSSNDLLKQCLESLLTEHEALLDLAEQKKQVLVHGPMNIFSSLVTKEMQRVNRIKNLENERQQLLGESLKTMGIQDTDHSMWEWIQLLKDVVERQTFTQLREQLRNTLVTLKQMNELNQKLIQQSLDYVNYSMGLYMGTREKEYFYQKPSYTANSRLTSRFIDNQG